MKNSSQNSRDSHGNGKERNKQQKKSPIEYNAQQSEEHNAQQSKGTGTQPDSRN